MTFRFTLTAVTFFVLSVMKTMKADHMRTCAWNIGNAFKQFNSHKQAAPGRILHRPARTLRCVPFARFAVAARRSRMMLRCLRDKVEVARVHRVEPSTEYRAESDCAPARSHRVAIVVLICLVTKLWCKGACWYELTASRLDFRDTQKEKAVHAVRTCRPFLKTLRCQRLKSADFNRTTNLWVLLSHAEEVNSRIIYHCGPMNCCVCSNSD
jgi:hypothetical protein